MEGGRIREDMRRCEEIIALHDESKTVMGRDMEDQKSKKKLSILEKNQVSE